MDRLIIAGINIPSRTPIRGMARPIDIGTVIPARPELSRTILDINAVDCSKRREAIACKLGKIGPRKKPRKRLAAKQMSGC